MQYPNDNIKNKAAAYRLLIVEAALTAVLTILILLGADIVTAYSVALGGLAFLLPNAAFARFAFSHSAAESAGLAMRGLYIGEAVKIITTVTIFAVSFILVKPLNVVALFAAYLLLLVINLAGVARMGTENREAKPD